MKQVTWDELFMSMVFLVSMKSKDPSTHIGAVIVGPDNEVRSIGYNGLPRNVNDYIDRLMPQEKYYWFEHAERNAIYNATLMGVSLKNSKMYTNGVPCADCARAVIQSGIKEVIVHNEWNNNNDPKWNESCNIGKEMLLESGVNIRYYDKPILEITGWRKGKELKYI